MAMNMFVLGLYFYDESYTQKAQGMLNTMKSNVLRAGRYYANWAILSAHFVEDPYEVAITGRQAIAFRKEMDQTFLPNVFFLGGESRILYFRHLVAKKLHRYPMPTILYGTTMSCRSYGFAISITCSVVRQRAVFFGNFCFAKFF